MGGGGSAALAFPETLEGKTQGMRSREGNHGWDRELSGGGFELHACFCRAGDQWGVTEPGTERTAPSLAAAETPAPHSDRRHQALQR